MAVTQSLEIPVSVPLLLCDVNTHSIFITWSRKVSIQLYAGSFSLIKIVTRHFNR